MAINGKETKSEPKPRPKPPAAQPKKAAPSAEMVAFLKAAEKNAPRVVMMANAILPIERIPTGVFEFDYRTGGGFPRGRISVVYGPESSGKSNIAYKAIANAQRLPPPCNRAILLDVESTFDPVWAAQLGVNVEELIVIKPDYGEQAIDMTIAAIQIDEVAIIVYDSIAATVPSVELEKSTEKADMGTQAILIKRCINKVVQTLSIEGKRNHFPAFIFVNQIRMKIGVMFGDPETMPGGLTFKFASSLTVRVYGKNEFVKEISSEIPAFKQTKMVIKKAKVGVMGYEGEYSLCMLPHDVLGAGESASWKMVESHLKNNNRLAKGKDGWVFNNGEEVFRTLQDMSMKYYTDHDFKMYCQDLVIKDGQSKAITIEHKDGMEYQTDDSEYLEGKL